MGRMTKMYAWQDLLHEVNIFTQLDTVTDDERTESKNDLINNVAKMQETTLTTEQIYLLRDIISSAHKCGQEQE